MEITARFLNTFDQRFRLEYWSWIGQGVGKGIVNKDIVGGPNLYIHEATRFSLFYWSLKNKSNKRFRK